MLAKLLLLMTLIPLLELVLLIQVGSWVGIWPTVLTVLVTGVVGALLLRYQGLVVLRRIRDAIGRGELPTGELMDGLLLVISAVLLVTPGMLTDLAGIGLLTPAGRALARNLLRRKWENWVRTHHLPPPGGGAPAPPA